LRHHEPESLMTSSIDGAKKGYLDLSQRSPQTNSWQHGVTRYRNADTENTKRLTVWVSAAACPSQVPATVKLVHELWNEKK
jgi:hypothetical protein